MKTDIFQELYDNEINFSVSCFWDGGFVARLGDDMNGWTAEADELRTWREVNNWLRTEAIKKFPASAFADKYRGLQ